MVEEAEVAGEAEEEEVTEISEERTPNLAENTSVLIMPKGTPLTSHKRRSRRDVNKL